MLSPFLKRSFAAGLVLALAPAAATAQPQERNDGWVTDRAGILSDQEERTLEALMESYKQGSTHEIALLTVEELGGQSIEGLALETARAWGLGQEGENNGALLVVAVKDRKMRIEVGRGLEGTLTDSISGRIIRDVIAPEFKKGRYYDGIHRGIVAMHQAVGGEYGMLSGAKGRRARGGAQLGCFNVVVMLFILLAIFGSRGGRGRRGSSGVLPWLLLSAMSGNRRGGGFHSSGGGGGFSGFGGGGGFSGGGASGGW